MRVNKEKVRLIALAAVVLSVAYGCVVSGTGKGCASSWEGKKVLVLGDSISDPALGNRWKNYWAYLPEMLGIEPVVYGVNGHQWTGVLEQAKKAKAEVGDSVDAVFVFAGTNDFNGDVPLGEWYDVKDTGVNRKGKMMVLPRRTFSRNMKTFRGRVNTVLEYLKTEFPDAQIVLLTPIHRAYFTCGGNNIQPDESYPNGLGLYVESYVDTVREGGRIWSVPVVDLYAESSLCPLIANQGALFANPELDRLHPSSEGHRRIALLLDARLRALPATFRRAE